VKEVLFEIEVAEVVNSLRHIHKAS